MGNITKIKSEDSKNTLIIKKNIMQEKELSINAKYIFMQIWSFNDKTWDLSIRGLSSIIGISENAVAKCLKELMSAGYLYREEKFTNKGKQVNYHIFECPELNDKKFLQDANLQPCNLQSCVLQPCKSEDNKTLNNKTLNLIEHQMDKPYPKNFLGDIQGQEVINEENMDTYKMNCLTSLEENNKKEIENVAQVKTSAQIKKEQRRLKRKQKLEEQVNKEQSKQMESVKNLADMTLNEQTEEEAILANARRLNNAAQEALNEVKRRDGRKSSVKTRMMNLIDTEVKDSEMKDLLKNFVSMWINIGKRMTEEIYTQQINSLHELSTDLETQKKIVRKSIEHGWLGFYPLNDNKVIKDLKAIPKQVNVVQNQDDYEDAVDENGNLLKF